MLKKTIIKSLRITGAHKIALRIYVFGSYITTSNPRDIDILFIFKSDETDQYKLAIKFRKSITLLLNRKLNLPVDVILLTEEEEKNMKFSNHEYAKLLLDVSQMQL